jgi:hypothetical protein
MMKDIQRFIRTRIPLAAALAAFGLACTVATADTVNAIWNSASDAPAIFSASGSSAGSDAARSGGRVPASPNISSHLQKPGLAGTERFLAQTGPKRRIDS